MEIKPFYLSRWVLMLLALAILNGCGRVTSGAVEQPVVETADLAPVSSRQAGNMSSMFRGTVVDVIDGGRYVYLQIDAGGEEVWVAAPAFEGKVGDTVLVPPGVPVADFQSKKLNRKIDMIYFVGGVRLAGEGETTQDTETPAQTQLIHPRMEELAEAPTVEVGEVEKAEGGKTVSEIITGSDALVGEWILIRARVVRVTPNIMGRNWLHVRDGSGSEGTNDLVVTTNAEVKAGDLVLIRGVVSVNRDFGFGRKYDILIEDAEVTLE